MNNYTLPELPYSTHALEPHYNAEALELHHQKHHAAYVKGLNQAQADLKEARDKNQYQFVRQLEKDLAFNLCGHKLHSLLWKSLNPDGGGTPPESVTRVLAEEFGSVEAFRQHFTSAAMGIQGSGWAVLSREPDSGMLLIEQVYDHQDNSGSGTKPLLVLDMWEHAFYLQYRNEKAKWVKAFWDVVNWQHLEEAIGAEHERRSAAA